MPTIVSLCDFSGEWGKPYREAGYRVVQVDPKLPGGFTVQQFLWRIGRQAVREALGEVRGVLMAPPCTDFSVSGAQYWGEKDRDGRTQQSLEIVDACLRVVEELKPRWWVLENPVGRLPKLRPGLGKPRMYFNPCDYGDPYTKKTGLWGEFCTDLPRTPVEPERVCSQGSWVQRLGGKSDRTKELRSMTPAGFARAFFVANP